jgi:putative ABC transport system substrate-binding protein
MGPSNQWLGDGLGGSNETARVHHASRRRGRRMAARGARAADAADHRVLEPDDDVGWIEGRAVALKVRWAEARRERAAEIVAEFVRQKADVIVCRGTASVLAAKRATSVIPIVFAGGDPVGTGLVVSLARAGGNVTGLSLQQSDLAGKRLELLRDVVPALRRLAILANAGNPVTLRDMREVEVAAPGLMVATVEIWRVEDIAAGFEALKVRADMFRA